jgi:hypothetical protein
MIHGKANELPFKVNYQQDGTPLAKAFQTNSEAHAFRATLIPPTKEGDLPTRMSDDRAPQAAPMEPETHQGAE